MYAGGGKAQASRKDSAVHLVRMQGAWMLARADQADKANCSRAHLLTNFTFDFEIHLCPPIVRSSVRSLVSRYFRTIKKRTTEKKQNNTIQYNCDYIDFGHIY